MHFIFRGSWSFCTFLMFGLILCLYSARLTAQNKPVSVEIEKKDATFLKGTLQGIVHDSVSLIDENNQKLKISLKDIRNIEYLDSLGITERRFEAPNMRYLLTSTAIPLHKNEIA